MERPPDGPLRVLIVDDVRAVAGALAMVVDLEADMTCAGTSATLAEARRHIAADPPDVILMDVYLADGDGIEAIAAMKAEGLGAAVVILTSAVEPAVLDRAEQAGAAGVLAKGTPFATIIASIRQAAAGGQLPR